MGRHFRRIEFLPLFAGLAADRTGRLTAEAEDWIGQTLKWEVTHLLDEGDEETPTGTPLCAVSVDQPEPRPSGNAFNWVPITDLASIEWDEETLAEASEEGRAVIGRQRFV